MSDSTYHPDFGPEEYIDPEGLAVYVPNMSELLEYSRHGVSRWALLDYYDGEVNMSFPMWHPLHGRHATVSAKALNEAWDLWIPLCREHGLTEDIIQSRISLVRNPYLKAALVERYLCDVAPENRAAVEYALHTGDFS